ncbi:hypothetical protein AB0N93_33670 [Streptomyces sp. NPDC091267]|uniref:hypothetical protein n=1 Tax=unclassified Streptomyces TaxID=2593676 RepID=UPI0034273152
MSPVTEQWEEVLRTRFALGEKHPAVRAAAAFSAGAGFFAAVGRDGEDGRQYFRSAAEIGEHQPDSGAPDQADLEALWTADEETEPASATPRTLRLAEVAWRRESLEQITDAVTGTDLDLALLRDGDRNMWVVRTRQGICIFVLVEGDNEAHTAEARSFALDFDSFLVGQGY